MNSFTIPDLLRPNIRKTPISNFLVSILTSRILYKSTQLSTNRIKIIIFRFIPKNNMKNLVPKSSYSNGSLISTV